MNNYFLQGAIFNNKNMPGIANIKQNIKKIDKIERYFVSKLFPVFLY